MAGRSRRCRLLTEKLTLSASTFWLAEGTRFAYIPDAKVLAPESMAAIADIPLLILDGLQMQDHNTHLSIPEAIAIAESAGARQTWLTHFSCRVDYQEIGPTLPDNVFLAHDGLKLKPADSN